MKGFLWGSTTAPYQCEDGWNEGNRVISMWDRYLHDNRLENGDVTSGHYHRFEGDIRMMKEGDRGSYRFSIAWPKIIRNAEEKVNQEGTDFYNHVIDACLKYDIEPFVTVFHWDLPDYLEQNGGWLNRQTTETYAHYAKVCLEKFEDRVRFWTTFNKPRRYTFSGYLIGNYPLGYQDLQETVTSSYYMILASAMAVKEFRNGGYQGQIGIIHSFSSIYGVDSTVEAAIAARYTEDFYNNWILDIAALGEIPGDLLAKLYGRCGLSMMKPEDLELIKSYAVDFLGLNYYARVVIVLYTAGETTLVVNNKGKQAKGTSQTIIKGWLEQMQPESSQYTEQDTEILPEGLCEGIRRVWSGYCLPVYITENGIGLHENVAVERIDDRQRIEFMDNHVHAVMQAEEEGCNVRDYCAWLPFDLYSRKNGTEERYGLVAIDYEGGLKGEPKKNYYQYRNVTAQGQKN